MVSQQNHTLGKVYLSRNRREQQCYKRLSVNFCLKKVSIQSETHYKLDYLYIEPHEIPLCKTFQENVFLPA